MLCKKQIQCGNGRNRFKKEFESLFLKISENNKNIVAILIVYRPPKCKIRYFIDELENFSDKNSDKNMIILGNINLDLLKIQGCENTKDFLNSVISQGFVSAINIPTRGEVFKGKLVQSNLDHIFIRQNKQTEIYAGVVTCKISDHYLVIAAISREHKKMIFLQSQTNGLMLFTVTC